MTEADAQKIVERLVRAATGAAMPNLPPAITVAMHQRLEAEKMRMVNALVTPNSVPIGHQYPPEGATP